MYVQSSWSASSVFHLFFVIIDLLTVLVTALLSTDGKQRKRKDDGELEGKPAKRKSVGNEDDSVPGGVNDVTAIALQNLQLANDPSEVRQNAVPATPSGLVTTTEHPLSASDAMSIKQASNTEYQPTGRANCV